MHRFRIVVAAALVSAMTLVTYQVASAGSTRAPARSSSAFCATAQSLQSEIQSLGDIDFETLSIARIRSTYRTYVDLVKQLQKQAPKELKNAFKRLRRFYDKVANGNIELDTVVRDVQRAGKDVTRVLNYLEDRCGITFETTTTT